MSKRLILVLLMGLSLPLIFQNCGSPFQTLNFSSEAGLPPLPFDHPDTEIGPQGTAVNGRLVMGDRLYLQSVFRDIFIPPGTPTHLQNYIEAVMVQEFAPTQNLLGRACDLNQEGSPTDCNGALANVEIQMNAATSSIREAARLQVCSRILGPDEIVNSMAASVRGRETTPGPGSVAAIVHLFFPANNAPAELSANLLELDTEMAEAGENLVDRWRILFLTVCESPAWQIL